MNPESLLHPSLFPFLAPEVDDETVHAIRQGHEQMFDHLLDDLPYECVGMLWTDGEVTRLINQARSDTHFSVGSEQVYDAISRLDDNKRLAAIYHSHPHGTPTLSNDDLYALREQWLGKWQVPWLIVVPDRHFYLWTLDSDDLQPGLVAYFPDHDATFWKA